MLLMLTYPLMIGWWEVVVIAFIVLLLFGGKKVPELMKGLGKGVKSFKDALDGKEDEEKKKKKIDDGSSQKPE